MASPCVHRRRVPGGQFTALTALLWLILAFAPAASAQDTEPVYDAPPHLALLDGNVEIVRDGRRDPATIGHILESGDRLDVRSGRAEILFGDGSAMHLDAGTAIDVLDEGLLRILGGRVYLHVSESSDAFEYRLDTPAASVYTDTPGEYRIVVDDRGEPVLELAVARGLASATTPADSVAVRAGEMVRIRAGERPGRPVGFNVAYWDDFGRWSYERRFGRVDAYARDLPAPLSPYAPAFAQYGHWDRHATYGAVWYPRVDRDWRPFYHGRWAGIAPYGWTWIGVDPWSWPTHHYGTWGVTSVGAWFWIPGARWRPAPVHWTITAAHVGWVPWGYGGVDVFGFTVIPRTVFAVNVFVPRHVIRVHNVRPVVRSVFISRPPPAPSFTHARRAFTTTRRPTSRVAVPRDSVVRSAPVDRRPGRSGPVDVRPGDARVGRPQRAAINGAPAPRPDPGAADPGGVAASRRRAISRVPDRAPIGSAEIAASPAPRAIQTRPADNGPDDVRRGGARIAVPRGGDDRSRVMAPRPAPSASTPPPAAPPRVFERARPRSVDDGGGVRRPAERPRMEAPSVPAPDRGGERRAVPRNDGGDRGGDRGAAGNTRGGGRRR